MKLVKISYCASGTTADYSGTTANPGTNCNNLNLMVVGQAAANDLSKNPCSIKCDTRSGFSEFRFGVYTVIPAAHTDNRDVQFKLIREYARRKLVNKVFCEGIANYSFFDNWLAGSLYMFPFKARVRWDNEETLDLNVRGTNYCQNLLYYKVSEKTSNDAVKKFYYRSTKWNGSIFQKTASGSEFSTLRHPTTIMDLGPRDLYTKEICSNPNFEGYLMKNLQSTSYNDQGDVLNLAIISRFVNKNYWLQVSGLGDKSVNRFFSRSGDRLDGDITQMFSINSEFGVVPFGDEEYDDNDLYVQGGNFNSMFGIFFSSDTTSRNILSPGIQTFSLTPPLFNYFGYSKTQEVPMYKWTSSSTAGQQTIFGTDNNEWDTNVTNNAFYSQKYQSMSFQYAPTTPYFNVTPTGQKGYIFNSDVNGNNDPNWTGTIQTPESFVVGAPFHFYFGLYKGKTALNKFITNYIGE